MKTYESNEEFFQAFEKVVQRIDNCGQLDAANCLREGFSSLNGLTDGWALLMDSILVTLSEFNNELETKDLIELKKILKVVQKVVYRK